MDKPFKSTLANGLRVILMEKHDAPVVSWNLWANVGSVNETPEIAGICHLIEHMLFKGTSRRAVGQIAREVEAAGGDMNAYTSFDETVFYINMSSKRMEVGLDILADAASDPTFDDTELTREKEVVVEEISRAEDNPSQMTGEDLFARVFTVHPYGQPIAGKRETVRGISRETLLKFYRSWYVGSNLILIGVGDFEQDLLMKQIEPLFSRIPKGAPPRSEIPREPSQEKPRVITRGMMIEGHYLDIGFPAPHLKHPDVPALDVLAQILGGGSSSRLEQRVREKKSLVTSVGSSLFAPRHPGLFSIGAVLKDGQIEPPLSAIWEEARQLRENRVLPVELARARENMLSGRIYEKQTAEKLARKLGLFEGIAEDLEFEEEYYRHLSEVTANDILESAQRYLSLNRLSLAFCHPKGESWKKLQETVEKLERTGAKKPSSARKEVSEFRLRSGTRLFIRENHTLPIISIRTASLGGTRLETPKNNGISHLTATLLAKGTDQRTAQEIAEEEEGICGNLSGYASRDLSGLAATFLAEKMSTGFELFSNLLLNPSFPVEEISREKKATLTAIRNQEDSLSTVAIQNFMSRLYPRHPYGLKGLGTASSVKGLSRKDLIRFHQTVSHPKNLVVAVSGDVDAGEIQERLEGKLKRRDDGFRVPKLPAPLPPATPQEIIKRRKEKFQSHLVYGFLGTTCRHRDRYALEVMNAILAGQGGRLFLELRDKQGLAYAISSSNQEGIDPGSFFIYMGCDPNKLETAIPGIRKEIGKITSSKASEEELSRAKRFLIGNYELDLQKNSTVAWIIASEETFGNGWREIHRYPEEIEKVTLDEVLGVARKYLRPDRSVLSIVKP